MAIPPSPPGPLSPKRDDGEDNPSVSLAIKDQNQLPRFSMIVAATLLLSGFIHLALFALVGTSWEGPLSLRKPALFGISGGLTTWSLAWLITKLVPRKRDRFLVDAMSLGLLVEVCLITMQYWRGVASHFNHATSFDTAIEMAMLVLILLVTLGIFYLTVRTAWLRDADPAMSIAIRGGMWLLALSCLLGIGTSVLGQMSIDAGKGYEIWGRAGVLKFPHGVALHAIQLLPILAWICHVLGVVQSARALAAALASQVLFLVYAVWQTSQGRDRFDCDWVGGGMLGVVVMLAMVPVVAMFYPRSGGRARQD